MTTRCAPYAPVKLDLPVRGSPKILAKTPGGIGSASVSLVALTASSFLTSVAEPIHRRSRGATRCPRFEFTGRDAA